MSKRPPPHRFSPFSITASFHLKNTSAFMFSRVFTQVTHIKLSLFSTQGQHTFVSYRLLHFRAISSLSQYIPPSLSVTRFELVVTSLNTFLA
ncbi:unnamed protein product [Hymenolepis diminuta]|uniref:Uncharacterized protein n=1 Tax=Hymenolepis diminuta TaxID=6216 RepID=A0A564Z471_HYMDI|nr:unnamed protein product [Hymenolepis diminuta]